DRQPDAFLDVSHYAKLDDDAQELHRLVGASDTLGFDRQRLASLFGIGDLLFRMFGRLSEIAVPAPDVEAGNLAELFCAKDALDKVEAFVIAHARDVLYVVIRAFRSATIDCNQPLDRSIEQGRIATPLLV